MIQAERIQERHARPVAPRGRYVLYLMQQAQRASCNHALEYAIRQANALGRPVAAVFGLTPDYPGAGIRHYTFLMEGLRDTQRLLARRGIRLLIRPEPPDRAALGLAREAALLVLDRGYTRIQREWRDAVARAAPCRVVEIESDAIVPVETAMARESWMAATLRPRLQRRLADFLTPLTETAPAMPSRGMRFAGPDLDVSDPAAACRALGLSRGPGPVAGLRGGPTAASAALERFLRDGLGRYADQRDDPAAAATSGLSPYLHFGQIAALEVALAARDAWAEASRAAFLEQLIVRRELALNFAWYNPAYDRYAGLPAWARKTLAAEAGTPRPQVYSRAVFESAGTHDPLWNAAQRQVAETGRLHGYLRMYWGKKILEWSAAPDEAFATAVALNDRYALDGRDPNGYAGVAWCFGKHDRPWPKHPVYGNVRMMSAAGLKKKFDTAAFLRQAATGRAP